MPAVDYVLLIVGAWLGLAACCWGVCEFIERRR